MNKQRNSHALVVFGLVSTILSCFGADNPQRISIAPTNDLTALIFTRPEQGSLVRTRWKSHTESYRSGWERGATNRLIGGYRNVLVIEDGVTRPAAIDETTGFPIIVLTDAKPTKELKEMVLGYNAAMSQVQSIHENDEPEAEANP